MSRELIAPFLRDFFVPGGKIEVRVCGPDGSVVREWYTDPEEVDPARYGASSRVWFGVAIRKPDAERGTKQDLLAVRALWADIDGPLPERFPVPPTWIVRSGGGHHAYWVLDRAVDLTDPSRVRWVEETLRGLAHSCRGDVAACDAARVLGLPYTWNAGDRKRRVYDPPVLREVVHHDPSAVLRIEEASRFRVGAGDGEARKLTQLPQPDLGEVRVSAAMKSLIVDGWHEGDPRYPSRSEADAAVVSAMIRAGHTDDEIRAVFGWYPVGGKARGDPGYLDRTIRKFRRVAAGEEGPPVGAVTERDGRLLVRRPHGWELVLSTTLRAVSRLVGEDRGFVVRVGDEELVLTADAMANATAFKRALGLSAAWFGTDKDVQRLLVYLDEQDPPEVRAVRTIGWVRPDVVVFPETEIRKDGRFVSGGYRYTGAASAARVAPPTRDYREWLPHLISRARRLQRMDTVLSWVAASFAAPFVRQKFNSEFPLLLITGPTGSGKTTILQIIARLAGAGVVESAAVTKWALVRLLSGSVSVPVILDEHRWGRDYLYATLRSSYNAQWESRGQANLDVRRYRLTAPVVVAGEAPWDDPALLERSVHVTLRQKDQDPADLARVESLPIDEFAASHYIWLMQQDLDELWDRASQVVDGARLLGPVASRQRHAAKVVVFGALTIGMDPMDALAFRLYSSEEDEYALVPEAVRIICDLVRTRQLRLDVDYRLVQYGGELCVKIPPRVLSMVEDVARRSHTVLPLTRRAIRDAMEGDRSGLVAGVRNEKAGRTFLLSVAKIEEVLDVPASVWAGGAA